MRSSARTLATLALFCLCSAGAAMAAAQGSVRGTVSDGSGGVMPGVTVVATSADGRVLATAVTDRVGSYAIGALPAGPIHLTFELEGFSTAAVDLVIEAGVESRVVQRLAIANRNETVVVRGTPPADLPPPRLPPPPPPPPPPPVVVPVVQHDHESICGPAKAGATLDSLGTIVSRRRGSEPDLYSRGDELVIDGGTNNGLEVGQNFVVRRYFPVSVAEGSATGEHTAGLVQIVATAERASAAVVIYACDEMMRGDFLAPFKPEPVRTPDAAGPPDFDGAARILFADAGQMLGAPRRLMVIDHGSDYGVRAGQRLTLFRRESRGARKPSVIGDAVVVAVRNDSATIRVERVTDAIASGDWAAPQRHSPGAPH